MTPKFSSVQFSSGSRLEGSPRAVAQSVHSRSNQEGEQHQLVFGEGWVGPEAVPLEHCHHPCRARREAQVVSTAHSLTAGGLPAQGTPGTGTEAVTRGSAALDEAVGVETATEVPQRLQVMLWHSDSQRVHRADSHAEAEVCDKKDGVTFVSQARGPVRVPPSFLVLHPSPYPSLSTSTLSIRPLLHPSFHLPPPSHSHLPV